MRIDARLAAALGLDQPLLFIEAQRAMRDAELIGQVCDRLGHVMQPPLGAGGTGLAGSARSVTVTSSVR